MKKTNSQFQLLLNNIELFLNMIPCISQKGKMEEIGIYT